MRHLGGGVQTGILLNKKEDYLTEDGAHLLARRIRAFWSRKGLYPTIRVIQVVAAVSPSLDGGCVWVVRSDMAGGKPRAAA